MKKEISFELKEVKLSKIGLIRYEIHVGDECADHFVLNHDIKGVTTKIEFWLATILGIVENCIWCRA